MQVRKTFVPCTMLVESMLTYTAEQCRFLHREHGPDGMPLPVTNWRGEIPPKYKTPPETCWTWFCEGVCKWSDQDCNFAHKNTGYLKSKQIDTHIQPGSTEALEKARDIGGGPKYPDVTCVHWLTDTKGCFRPAENFEFAHRNTGMLGNTIGAFKPINANLEPVSLQRHNPPHTCYHWLRDPKGCRNSANNCKFAHKNTGYLATHGRGVQQIDPSERPRAMPTPVSTDAPVPNLPPWMRTCFFWDRGICKLPEENCKFLHRYTGVVAFPPIGWIDPPGYTVELRRDSVPRQHQIDSPLRMQADEPLVELPAETARQSSKTRGDNGKTIRHAEDPRPESPSQSRNDIASAVQPLELEHREEPKELQQEVDSTLKSNGHSVDAEWEDEKVKQLDLSEMLRSNCDQCEDIVSGTNALVLYDPSVYQKQPRILEQWLATNDMNIFNTCRIGFNEAWNGFKEVISNGGVGIILAPPDFEGYSSLPGFGDVLRGTVCLWSIGHQPKADHSIWDAQASAERPWDYFAIFPHGGTIYITDDVFQKKPQLALAIFEHFFAKIEAGRSVDADVYPGMYINDGILLWRIGVRPELMKWIGDICEDHRAEIEDGDSDYVRYVFVTRRQHMSKMYTDPAVSLEKLYLLLHDSGYCEPDGHFSHAPDNRRLDFFPIISMRQELAEDVGLYYEARKQSQHEANTDMAHHYSGLVIMERRNYRHYFVVHTDPGEVDWKETITTIDEVITPEKCIEYFEQEPKGSKFDNYEWAYPPKRTDSVTAPPAEDAVKSKQPVQSNQCGDCGLNSAECPCGFV